METSLPLRPRRMYNKRVCRERSLRACPINGAPSQVPAAAGAFKGPISPTAKAALVADRQSSVVRPGNDSGQQAHWRWLDALRGDGLPAFMVPVHLRHPRPRGFVRFHQSCLEVERMVVVTTTSQHCVSGGDAPPLVCCQ
jgi:hypothetical protein